MFAKPVSCQNLNGSTYLFKLQLPDSAPAFIAGQYLLLMLDGTPCPYSIASHRVQQGLIELHIQCQPGDSRSTQVIEQLQNSDSVEIELPFGECTLPADIAADEPLIFMAAASGFSQMHSLLEEVFSRGLSNPLHLYWGVRNHTDYYLLDRIEQWQQAHPQLKTEFIVSEPGDDWQGRSGILVKAVCEDFQSLEDAQLFISGSPAMVYGSIDFLKAEGLTPGNCHSDVFSYAPREPSSQQASSN